jgi:hypothetical protein
LRRCCVKDARFVPDRPDVLPVLRRLAGLALAGLAALVALSVGPGVDGLTSVGATGASDETGAPATGAGSATSSYSFLSQAAPELPMRYDPCVPVRFVINPEGAPAGAIDEVREAFTRLGEAAGIAFVDGGFTAERHRRIGEEKRPAYQPTRYGVGRWAPILISWVSAVEEPVLDGDVLGYGGSTSHWNADSDQAYVSGEVVFDRELSLVRPGFGPGLTRGNLVLHELAHLAGLDHVDQRSELMHAKISDRSPDGYGAGDLAGLAHVGAAAGCLRVASPLGGVL